MNSLHQVRSVRILHVLQPSLVALAFLLAMAVSSRAGIHRWDNGQLIPGTEGITPGPGVQLDHIELEFADLYERSLSDASFDSANLNAAWQLRNDSRRTSVSAGLRGPLRSLGIPRKTQA